MGGYAELCADTHGLTKAMQDEHADESYRRAHAASFSDEVTPVTVNTRKGKIVVSTDDGLAATPKPASGAKPAFKKDGGTVTAANASTISDGAAAVVLMSRAAAEAHGAVVLATIRGFGDAEQEPQWFTTAPAAAIPRALKHAGLEGVSAVDYFEINEAFSVVSLANNRLLDIDPAKVRAQAPRRPPQPQEARNRRVCLRVITTPLLPPPAVCTQVNVRGGAVALGHPIGASGARIVVTLLSVLQEKGGKIGVAGICNGGGGASAIVIESE
eukprot:scaffold11391_cov125-Isochrysis_galbana.AAC.3